MSSAPGPYPSIHEPAPLSPGLAAGPPWGWRLEGSAGRFRLQNQLDQVSSGTQDSRPQEVPVDVPPSPESCFAPGSWSLPPASQPHPSLSVLGKPGGPWGGGWGCVREQTAFWKARLCAWWQVLEGSQVWWPVQAWTVGLGHREAGRPGCMRSLPWEAEAMPGQALGLPEAPGARRRPGV